MDYLFLFAMLMTNLFVIIVHLSVYREHFYIADGRCECCECGYMSCNECALVADKCCKNQFEFIRYTFS